MPPRERALSRAARRADRIRDGFAAEVRSLRRRAGLTQAELARLVGSSRSTIGKIEQGRLRRLEIETAARIAAVLGAELSLKVYPAGPPVRDAGHLALIDRMQPRISSAFGRQFEAPLPISGDARSIDQLLTLKTRRIGLEYETAVNDLQELQRRLGLKRRDGNLDCLILVIRASTRNRRVMRESGTALRTSLPLTTHEVLRALREGRVPPADGIVFL